MDSYPVQDIHGNVIGSLALHSEVMQDQLMDGFRFELGCTYSSTPGNPRRFMGFLVVPMPATQYKKED